MLILIKQVKIYLFLIRGVKKESQQYRHYITCIRKLMVKIRFYNESTIEIKLVA